jgi:Transposase
MTTFADAETAQVLGVVDGRDSAGVGTWLAARSCAWREGIEVVAIDPSAAFRRALRIVLRDTLTYEWAQWTIWYWAHSWLRSMRAVRCGCGGRWSSA